MSCSTNTSFAHTWEFKQIKDLYLRIDERELIGTNIKQFHAKIKLRCWDTEKKLQNRLSRRAPLKSFINFYRGLKLMAELVRI